MDRDSDSDSDGGYVGIDDIDEQEGVEAEDADSDDDDHKLALKYALAKGGADATLLASDGLPVSVKHREAAIVARAGPRLAHIPVTEPLEEVGPATYAAPTAVSLVHEDTERQWPSRKEMTGSKEEDDALVAGAPLDVCVLMAERMDAPIIPCSRDGREQTYRAMSERESGRVAAAQRHIDEQDRASRAAEERFGGYELPYRGRALVRAVTSEGRTVSFEVPIPSVFYVRVDAEGQKWTSIDTLGLETWLEQRGCAPLGSVKCAETRRRHILQMEMSAADPLKPRTYRYLKCEFPSEGSRQLAVQALRSARRKPVGMTRDTPWREICAEQEAIDERAKLGGKHEEAYQRQRVSVIKYLPFVVARREGKRRGLTEEDKPADRSEVAKALAGVRTDGGKKTKAPGGFDWDTYHRQFGDKIRDLLVVPEETRMPSHVHIYRELGVQPMEWCRVSNYRLEWPYHPDLSKRCRASKTTCEAHLQLPRVNGNLVPLPDRKDVPPLLEVGFDIEQRGRPGRFPTHDDMYCAVTAVCMTLQWSGGVPKRARRALEACRLRCVARQDKILVRDGELDTVPRDQASGPLKTQQPCLRIGLCSQESLAVRGCVFEVLPSERRLVRRFFHIMSDLLDPDIVLTWNGWRYDDRMMYDRAKTLGLLCQTRTHWCRDVQDALPLHTTERQQHVMFRRRPPLHPKTGYYVKELRSNALGANEFKIGFHRFSIDGWFFFRTQYNQQRYSLGFTAKKYLKVDGKDPIKVAEINCAARRDATKADVAKLMAYCARDTDLTCRLVTWGGATQQLIGQSRASGLEVAEIMRSGKGIIVFSCLARFSWERGFIVNDHKSKRFVATKKYSGGRVLLPTPGTCPWPVAVLDFAGLYPSIIRWRNYCYSTYLGRISDERAAELLAAGLPLEQAKASLGSYWFVRWLPEDPALWPPGAKCRGVLGMLPELEEMLVKNRKIAKKNKAKAGALASACKAARKLLEEHGDKDIAKGVAETSVAEAEARLVAVASGADDWAFRQAVGDAKQVLACVGKGVEWCELEMEVQLGLKTRYDAEQKALKVIMNSIYGVTGGRNGHLPCAAVADSICSMGAMMIDNCRFYVTERYGEDRGWKYGPGLPCNVVYGDTDSVMVQVPMKPGDFAEGIRFLRRMELELTQMFQLEVRDETERFRDMYRWIEEKGSDWFDAKHGRKPDKNNAVEMECETFALNFTNIADPNKGTGIKKKYYCSAKIDDPTEDHGRRIDAGEDPLSMGKVYIKGIQTQRRDAPSSVNNLIRKCMDVVLTQDPIEKIEKVLMSGRTGMAALAKDGTTTDDPALDRMIAVLHEGLTDMVENRLPLHDYVITTSVKGMDQYSCKPSAKGNAPAPPDALVLVWLAEKAMRGSGEDPGERTGLVYRQKPDPRNYEPPSWIKSPFAGARMALPKKKRNVDRFDWPVKTVLERPNHIGVQNPVDRARYCMKLQKPLMSLFYPARDRIARLVTHARRDCDLFDQACLFVTKQSKSKVVSLHAMMALREMQADIEAAALKCIMTRRVVRSKPSGELWPGLEGQNIPAMPLLHLKGYLRTPLRRTGIKRSCLEPASGAGDEDPPQKRIHASVAKVGELT